MSRKEQTALVKRETSLKRRNATLRAKISEAQKRSAPVVVAAAAAAGSAFGPDIDKAVPVVGGISGSGLIGGLLIALGAVYGSPGMAAAGGAMAGPSARALTMGAADAVSETVAGATS